MLTTHAQVDPKALLVSLVSMVPPETMAALVCPVCLATIHQSNWQLLVNACGAHPDHLAPLARPDLLDPLEAKEALVFLAVLATMAALAQPEPLDPRALLAQTANPDQLVALVPTRPQAAKVTLDPKEATETPAQEVPMATVALQEKLAQLDPLAPLEALEALARTEKKDPTAHLVPKVAPDQTPNTVPALTAPRNTKHPDVHWIRRRSNDFLLDSIVKCFLLYLSMSAKPVLSKT